MHANSLPLSSRTSLCDLARQATLSSDSGAEGAVGMGVRWVAGGGHTLNEARGVRISAEAILSWRCESLRRGALRALMWKRCSVEGWSRRHSEGFPFRDESLASRWTAVHTPLI